jgi:hypothetical protein
MKEYHAKSRQNGKTLELLRKADEQVTEKLIELNTLFSNGGKIDTIDGFLYFAQAWFNHGYALGASYAKFNEEESK